MLVILKIPVIYLCGVVWYAIRAVPEPLEPAVKAVPVEPAPKPGWRFSRLRPRRRGPDRGPARGPRRVAKAEVGR